MPQYRIADLLANSVQPFDNLTAAELATFGESFTDDSAKLSPIVVANMKPPVLIEGNQRCRLYQSKGRVELGDHEVVVADHVTTREQALEYAITLNVNRRSYTIDQKAALARKFQVDHGWSQRKIATLMGVSQKTVSVWQSSVPGDQPVSVTGADGKTYTYQPTQRKLDAAIRDVQYHQDKTPEPGAEPAALIGELSAALFEDSVKYLNGVGPRSNLGKIREALEAIEAGCRDGVAVNVRAYWEDADRALDNAEDICSAGSGEEQDAKQEAREELESAIESLLTAIEEETEAPAEPEPEPKPAGPPKPAFEGSLCETLSAWLGEARDAVVKRDLNGIRLDRGTNRLDPNTWKVTVPAPLKTRAADMADVLRTTADDLTMLAKLIDRATIAPKRKGR